MYDTGLDPQTEARFEAYLDEVGSLLRDKRQRASFAMYAAGLLSDGERKSMEPIAARASADPDLAGAHHQRLIHFLASSPWKDAPVRTLAARYAVDEMERHDAIHTWVVDDTGFLKQGKHSPGVQRQYTGSAGKRANCQIGVSLVLANRYAEVPVDFKLYIPQSWAQDRDRCRAAHIPDDVGYRPKWQLALDMIESAIEADLPQALVLADSGYGDTAAFRAKLDVLGLPYAVDVKSHTLVRRVCADGKLGKPMSVKKLGRRLKSKFNKTTWRQGSKVALTSRFTRVRVVVGHGDKERGPRWLLIEWPQDEADPTHFVLSTLPETVSIKDMVATVKNRWRIERSYEDLKGQLGLDHYEGRSFVGWHHHVSVVLTCYAFLVAERSRSFSPSATWTCPNRALQYAA